MKTSPCCVYGHLHAPEGGNHHSNINLHLTALRLHTKTEIFNDGFIISGTTSRDHIDINGVSVFFYCATNNLQGSGSSAAVTAGDAFETETRPPCISHRSCGPDPEGHPIDSAS